MVRLKWLVRFCFICFFHSSLSAQTEAPSCRIVKGETIIEIPVGISDQQIDSFIVQYNLVDISLRESLKSGRWDKARQQGWNVSSGKKYIVLKKRLEEWEGFNEPFLPWLLLSGKGRSTDKVPGIPQLFTPYGVNKFTYEAVTRVNDTSARFFLKGYLKAKEVLLSGSFNDWSTLKTLMQRTDSGWVATLPLAAGKHLYKYIVDGRWIADPGNRQQEEDGYLGHNSVYFHTNTVFRLPGYGEARNVILSGSFNNWDKKELPMIRDAQGWQLPLFLKDGTYTYKFIADRNWITDPENPYKIPDGSGGFNAVISLGDAYVFRLAGYRQARYVFVAGNFNNWNPGELALRKTDSGWELPYVLSPGIYSYKYIVDGNWITDPANKTRIDDGEGNMNSVLVFKGNYTFRLNGYSSARNVLLSGSFISWSPNTLEMKREGNSWVYTVYLPPGKHLYKFIVDGSWIIDPGNPVWEENAEGTGNSVLWIKR